MNNEPQENESRLATKLREFKFHDKSIPSHMQTPLLGYIENYIPTGSFLHAILANDLEGAVSRADETNLWLIPVYVSFLYNEAPITCWGSHAKVISWLSRREGK